jgi:hypothetical protein
LSDHDETAACKHIIQRSWLFLPDCLFVIGPVLFDEFVEWKRASSSL